MQLAKQILKFSTITAAIVYATLASAQVTMPSSMSSSLAEVQVPVGVAAKAVVIGKADSEKVQGSGTLKELEILQREAFLAELRAKIHQVETNNRDKTLAPNVMPPGFSGTMQEKFVRPNGTTFPGQSQMFSPGNPQFNSGSNEPTAQLVNVIVSKGKAHADVIEDGVIKTVSKGSKLGLWTVTSIEPGEVLVERVVRRMPPDVSNKPVALTSGMKRKKAIPAPTTPVVQAISHQTASLKLYQPPEVRTPIALAPGAIVTPRIPPLPSQIKFPDSTSFSAEKQVPSSFSAEKPVPSN